MADSRPLPILRAGALELRPASAEDAAALFALEHRCAVVPLATRFLLRPPPSSVDEVRARIERSSTSFSVDHTAYQWLLRIPEETAVVGYVAFIRWDHENHKSEVAYVVDPVHWGKRFAAVATARILDLGWRELGLHRAEAHIDPENHASIRTAEKLGFVLEGTLRDNVLCRGTYVDTAIYATLAPSAE